MRSWWNLPRIIHSIWIHNDSTVIKSLDFVINSNHCVDFITVIFHCFKYVFFLYIPLYFRLSQILSTTLLHNGMIEWNGYETFMGLPADWFYHPASWRLHTKDELCSSISMWWYQDLISTGWWFQPLWKIWVSWGYYSQHMEKCSKPVMVNSYPFYGSRLSTYIIYWYILSVIGELHTLGHMYVRCRLRILRWDASGMFGHFSTWRCHVFVHGLYISR